MSSIGVAVTDQESLTDMVWANAERFGDAVGFRRQEPDAWLDVTTREFAAQVLAVARGLLAAGRQPGERIPLGGTGYEWAVAQFAIWTAGCVSVPGPPGGLDLLAENGREVADRDVHARRLAVRAGDRATADATHRELLGAVRATVQRHPRLLGAGASMLIRVPMDRPAARVLALGGVYTRTTLAISTDADLGMYRPTVIVAEPPLLAEIYDAARRRAVAEDRGRLFDAAATVAVDYSRALEGSGPGIGLVSKHLAAGRLVYPKVRAALGGRCVAVLCPGALPDARLRHFFRGIGVAVHSV